MLFVRRRDVADIRNELIDLTDDVNIRIDYLNAHKGVNVDEDVKDLIKIQMEIGYIKGLRASYDEGVRWYRSEAAINNVIFVIGWALWLFGAYSGVEWAYYIGIGMVSYNFASSGVTVFGIYVTGVS